MVSRVLRKLFIGGEWGIGYRTKDDKEFTIIDTPKGVWFADPMLFEFEKKHYLFAEVYEIKKRRACLGFFEFVNGKPEFRGKIIENNYHMSYPCVFQYENNIYMIPESSANLSLELYQAVDFPTIWELSCVLGKNLCLVDSTFFLHNGNPYLLSYEKVKTGWDLVIFLLNLKGEKGIKEIERKHYNSNIGRPAGNIVDIAGEYIRPAQNCQRKYGESIIQYQLDSIIPYSEKKIGEITIKDISIEKKIERVHTYNEDSEYQVIDFFVEKFELFKAMDILKRSHFKKTGR